MIKKLKLSFKETLTYYSLKGVSWFIARLPRKFTIQLGRGLGRFAWYVIPIRKSVALNNLTIAFPTKSNAERRELLKKCYSHFGLVLMEFLRMRFLTPQKLAEILEFSTGSLELLKALKKGIIITGHLGNWEMFMPAFGWNGIIFHGVATTQKNIGAHRFFSEARESFKAKLIFKGESSKKMVAAVKDGFIGLASDQYAGRDGIWVKSFGRETSTPAGAAVFYRKTGAPVLFGQCVLQKNLKYKLSVEELDCSNLSSNIREMIYQINKMYSAALEDQIKLYPEQYFWFHRKWRRKKPPKGKS